MGGVQARKRDFQKEEVVDLKNYIKPAHIK